MANLNLSVGPSNRDYVNIQDALSAIITEGVGDHSITIDNGFVINTSDISFPASPTWTSLLITSTGRFELRNDDAIILRGSTVIENYNSDTVAGGTITDRCFDDANSQNNKLRNFRAKNTANLDCTYFRGPNWNNFTEISFAVISGFDFTYQVAIRQATVKNVVAFNNYYGFNSCTVVNSYAFNSDASHTDFFDTSQTTYSASGGSALSGTDVTNLSGINPVDVFVDYLNDDFTLLVTSPLLGAGSTGNNIGVDQTTEAANQAPVADDDSFSIFTSAQVGDVVGTVPVSDSDGTVDSASITGTNFDIDTAGEITVISTSGLSVGTITEDATFTDNDGDSTVVTITINVTAPQLAISSVSSYSVAANANFTVSYNNADAVISAFITLNNTDYALTKVSDTSGVATFTAPFLPDFGDFTANFDTDLTVNITDGTTTTQFPQAFRVQKIAAATDTIGVITTPSPVGDYKDVVGDPSGATSYRQSLTGDSTGDIATGLYTVTQAASARYRLYDGVWGDWFTVNYPAPVEVVNQAPTANAQTFSIQDDAANNSQIGQFVATDSDGTIDGDGYSSSNPSVSITTGGMLLLADNSGLTAGTPLTGTISFRDNDGATGSANFTVNVTAAPVQATPPSARPDSPIPATLYVKVSEPYPLAQHVLNPDGAALSYAVAQNSPALPANVSLNASTGQLSTTDNSYTPVEDLEIEVLLA